MLLCTDNTGLYAHHNVCAYVGVVLIRVSIKNLICHKQFRFDDLFFHPHVFFGSYSKVESLEPGCEELLRFTFLLVSSGDLPSYKNSHSVLERVEGFSRLALDRQGFPPLKIVLKDKIAILVNKNVSRTILET